MSQVPITTRREILMLLGAGMTAHAGRLKAADAAADVELRHVLDGLDAAPDPAARLAALARFSPRRLSRCARLDLLTVRIGLGFEARLAALPAGAAGRYALELARACGAELSPDAAERQLTGWVRRLEAEAGHLFAGLGMTTGSLGTRFRALLDQPAWQYPDSDAGRDAAVADMNRWLSQARSALPRWFGPLPAECLDVAVRRMTAEEIAAGKGGFRILPGPGKRGYYVVDLGDIARRPRWTLRSVVHHELLPGHMIQLPLQQRAEAHPLRLRYAAAFIEGWAIHAEALAWHGGLIADPAEQLGVIHWLLFRTCRGLADLALHHRGQDRAAVEAMFERLLGFPAYFAPFAADLQQIVAHPGIRAAEALIAGRLALIAGRTGDQRAFHARLLACGARPMSLLDS